MIDLATLSFYISSFIIICIIGYCIFNSVKNMKIENVKEWLKWAVTIAEKELGSGTGQLKLRQVYNMAVDRFPWIIKLISFETFSHWVDDALQWMNNQLANNVAVSNFIKQ